MFRKGDTGPSETFFSLAESVVTQAGSLKGVVEVKQGISRGAQKWNQARESKIYGSILLTKLQPRANQLEITPLGGFMFT